ncbi:MAG TPA: DMT family transporter [Thermoleophilia bacterium]|nr:DMT family transporter [Thermoleophilia bacterium]
MIDPSARIASLVVPKHHRAAPWLPLAAGVLWGTSFPAMGLALVGFPPLTVAFLRALVGFLSLGAWLWLRGGLTSRPSPQQWLRLVALSLMGAGLFWPVLIFSIELSSPVNSAFLTGIYPALAAGLAPLVLGERTRRANLLGLALALGGAYLVISKGRPLALFSSSTLTGDSLALLAALLFAAYILLGQKWRQVIGVSGEELTFYTFALALPPLGVLAMAGGPLLTTVDVVAVAAIVWLGLMASTAAFLALNWGIRSGAVARGSMHLMVIPLVAAACSWLIFGTTMTPAQWLGGALVVLGVGASR